jgi:general secretion pathway protein A
MYLKFYGLMEKPFELAPDPRFLFQTPGHREALAQLVYGVQEQKGFILMVGEVGTGKTTLLRTLVQRLNGQAECAFIVNSTLPFDELLEYTLADFGVEDPGGTRAQRLMALNHFLIRQRRAGRKTVLIIDEAQNLDIQTLEQIRLLSNFETSSGKLLQIILSGQPELHSKLKLPQLRQLKQRIALRCVLQPLADEEVGQYIINHFRVAGARGRQPFTTTAIVGIARYSGGIPRIVNIICDHCLLIGYANQVREIDGDTVRRAVDYLESGASGVGWKQFLRAGRPVDWKHFFNRPAVEGYSRRAVVWLAGAAAAAAATVAVMSLSANRSAFHAVAATVVAAVGGVVRWLTHWWGS